MLLAERARTHDRVHQIKVAGLAVKDVVTDALNDPEWVVQWDTFSRLTKTSMVEWGLGQLLVRCSSGQLGGRNQCIPST